MYSDQELHQMYDDAMRRNDKLLATAIMAVAMARSSEAQTELQNLHTMFMGYLITKHEVTKEGGDNEQFDLTAIDPNRVIQL